MPPIPRSPFGPTAASAQDVWRKTRVWRSVAFLVAGSLWDILTLTRIDRWSDQLFVLGYQLLLVVTLTLDLRWKHPDIGPDWAKRFPNVMRYISQFALGGLLSVYAIYTFRGAGTLRAVVYASLLGLALLANEFWNDRLRSPGVRLAILCYVLLNGFLFAIPVWTGILVSPWVAAIPALIVTALAATFAIPTQRSLLRMGEVIGPSVLSVLVVVLLIVTHILPPLPLSLQRVGVFRDVAAEDDGIVLSYESPGGWIPWRYDRELHWQPGETVWCYTAVFAPRGMDIAVVHHWEHWTDDGWQQTDALTLDVSGGRAEGFRTWTRKQHLSEGRWRVRVMGPMERELGEVHFTVSEGPSVRPIVTTVED